MCAVVIGPLYSVSASGKVGDSMVYGTWRGINWVRAYAIPANPQSTKQVNVRTAMNLLVEKWKTLSQSSKDEWNDFAEGKRQSGVNFFTGRGMDAYIAQIGVDTTPASVAYSGVPPAETWTWT